MDDEDIAFCIKQKAKAFAKNLFQRFDVGFFQASLYK